MPYTLPGTFVDGSTTVPVSATNLNEYTTAITDLDTRAPIRGAFTNPNGNVTGSPGNLYENTNGGTGTTLWVKESGTGTNTGWVATGTGGGVPTSRQIATGTGLLGGGDLTADRTLLVQTDTTTQRVEVAQAGTLVGTRKRVNLIQGSNVTLTTIDDTVNNKVDVTISSSGGSGSPDATTTSKGIIQLAGDLGGTAAAPTVPVRSVAGRTGAVTLTKADVGLSNVANVDAIPKSTITTFGDLISVNFGGTIVRVPGPTADGQVLSGASAETPGMTWQTPTIAVNYLGTAITPTRPSVDFYGPGVTVVDDSGLSRTKITVSGSKTAPTPESQNFVSWSADPGGNNSGTTPVAGTVYLTKLLLPSANPSLSISSIYWCTTGIFSSVTASQNFIGIYNPNGTRLATVNVDSDLTSVGLKTASTGSINVTGLTFVWVGFVFNAGTMNNIARIGNTLPTLTNAGLTAAFYRSATNGTSQTSLPASITPASNVASIPLWWAAAA